MSQVSARCVIAVSLLTLLVGQLVDLARQRPTRSALMTSVATDRVDKRDDRFQPPAAPSITTNPWQGLLESAVPSRMALDDYLPTVLGNGVMPSTFVAAALPHVPMAPQRSRYPIDFGYGQKIESATDATVALRGRDFELTRIYSSKPPAPSSTTESGPGAVGMRWTMNVLRAGRLADNDLAFTVTEPGGSQHTFTRATTTDPWIPAWPTTQILEPAVITISVDSVEQQWAVYWHEEPGQWITCYYRQPTIAEQSTVNPLPASGFEGLVLQERDVYNNQWTYAYEVIDLGSLELPDQPRPVTIYLNPVRDTLDDWAARIDLTWHAADDTPAPAAAQIGRLAQVEILRNIRKRRTPDSALRHRRSNSRARRRCTGAWDRRHRRPSRCSRCIAQVLSAPSPKRSELPRRRPRSESRRMDAITSRLQPGWVLENGIGRIVRQQRGTLTA